ncbi:MAG: RHS repeat-associated core domain-containing protein [Pseudomonadota bacterium]
MLDKAALIARLGTLGGRARSIAAACLTTLLVAGITPGFANAQDPNDPPSCGAPGQCPVVIDGDEDCYQVGGFSICVVNPFINRWFYTFVEPAPEIPTAEDASDTEEAGLQPCTDPNNQGAALVGNPFNLFSGNKVEQSVDYLGAGRLPLMFSRTFNSRNVGASAGPLGEKWQVGVPRLEQWWSGLSNPAPGSDWLGMILVREDGQRVKIRAEDGPLVPGTTNVTTRFERTNGRIERLYQTTTGTWNYFDGTMEYRFDSSGKLTLKIDHPTGEYLKYDYNAQSGRSPSQITHNSGRKLIFQYTSGRLTRMTDPGGKHTDYSYHGNGNLRRVDFPNGAYEEYFYEDPAFPDYITRRIDQAGRQTTWGYDANGYAVSSEGNGGTNKVSVVSRSNANGEWQVRTRNVLGKEAIHKFREFGGRKKLVSTDGIALANCSATSQTTSYDANGYYDVVTDREGNVIDYDYSANGLLTQLTEAPGTTLERWTRYEYDPHTEQVTLVENQEQDAAYTYDSHGRLTEVRLSDKSGPLPDRVWTITYPVTSTTAEGTTLVRQVFVDGPKPGTADTSKVFIDSAGRVASVLDPANHLTRFLNYDAWGRPLTIQYPSGMATNVTYNDRGWLTSKTDVVDTKYFSNGYTYQQNRTTSYDYKIDGSLSKVTFPDGTYLQFFYDTHNRLNRIENTLGEYYAFERDLAGNIKSERIQHDETTTTIQDVCCNHHGEPVPTIVTETVAVTDKETLYDYDALSRLEKITDGNSNWSLIRYNKNDLVRLVQDAKGQQTTQEYNARNELDEVLNPDGGVVAMTYDNNALLSTVTDAIGVTTTYTRNGHGEAEVEYSPDSGNWRYEYDESGNITKVTDGRNYVTDYHYDVINRLERIEHPSGTDTVFTYDTTSGWLAQVTDDSGSTTFERDTSGAITQKISVVDGVTMTTKYQYDVMGRVDQALMPGGTRLYYDYDNAGQVERIRASHPSFSLRNLASNITYKPFGPLIGVTLGSNQVRALDYDSEYRLTQLISANQIHKSYQYDANDNIIAVTNGSGSGNRTYDYDEMDRLDFHWGPEGTYYLDFDENGNLTRKNSYSYDNHHYQAGSNRLTSANGSVRWYDTNGNTTRRGSDYLTYDDRNRLSYFHKWAGHVNTYYRYNAFGERVQKYRTGFDQKFVYGNGARLLHEQGSQGTVDYVYLNEQPIAMVRNGSIYYLHTDHLGRPIRAVTETNSFTVWIGDDRPWETGPGTTYVDVNIRFPGQYFDSESELYYNYFRYYDPTTGRYLSSDPIGLGGGLNRFAYAGSNPTKFTDPFGLDFQDRRHTQNGAAFGCVGGATIVGSRSALTCTASGPGYLPCNGLAIVCGCIGGSILGAAVGTAQDGLEELAVRGFPQSMFNKSTDSGGNEDDDRGAEAQREKRRKTAPKNKPHGTKPIDKDSRAKGKIHDIKPDIGAAADDWVGVTPDGEIVVTDPDTGETVWAGVNVNDY